MAGEISSMGQEIFFADWKMTKEDWAYESADDPIYVVHACGDVRSSYQLGWRLKLVQNGVAAYFIIVYIDYVGGYTLLYLLGGTDYDLTSDDITERYYSSAKAPLGFNPDEDKWSIIESVDSDDPEPSPTAGTWYGSYPQITIPIGKWLVKYDAQLKAVATTAQALDMFVTLTNTGGESDKRWTAKIGVEDGKSVSGSIRLENIITRVTRDYYRLRVKTDQSGLDSINLEGGSVRPTRIKAVCAYL